MLCLYGQIKFLQKSIHTDGKSKELGYALIAVLDSEDNDLPLILTKDEFWSIYKSSKVVPTTDYSFELDL